METYQSTVGFRATFNMKTLRTQESMQPQHAMSDLILTTVTVSLIRRSLAASMVHPSLSQTSQMAVGTPMARHKLPIQQN